MKIPVLIGGLAVQIIVIGIVFALQYQSPEEPSLFLDFDAGMVDRMTVVSSDETVELQKNADSWELLDGLPADHDKVEDLIEKMAGLQAGWPVATSQSTAERFEVTEDSFQKHVVLHSGEDVVADFYLGTSPGYQRVHARIDGPVYSVKLSNYEFGSKASSWLNKQLLRPEGRLSRIERVGGFVLTRGDEGWNAAQEGELDTALVDSFAQRFTNLSVYDISTAELPNDPRASFVLLDESGELELDMYYLEEDEDWVATSSRVEGKFGVSTYIAEDMSKEFEDLLVKDETEEETDEESIASPSIGDELHVDEDESELEADVPETDEE